MGGKGSTTGCSCMMDGQHCINYDSLVTKNSFQCVIPFSLIYVHTEEKMVASTIYPCLRREGLCLHPKSVFQVPVSLLERTRLIRYSD